MTLSTQSIALELTTKNQEPKHTYTLNTKQKTALANKTTPCLQINCAKLFLSELRQIYTNFDNFWQKDGKRLKLCEMHSISASSNPRHHTAMLNADVRNCYTTLKFVICSKLSNDSNSTSKVKCGLFSRIISSYNCLV